MSEEKEKKPEITQPNPEVEQERVPEFEQVTEHPDQSDIRMKAKEVDEHAETLFEQY